MTEKIQMELALIPHHVETSLIEQRVVDGYINATELCRAAGKQFNDWFRLKTTEAFLEELSAETGIPVSDLVQAIKGGNPRLQGTWINTTLGNLSLEVKKF